MCRRPPHPGELLSSSVPADAPGVHDPGSDVRWTIEWIDDDRRFRSLEPEWRGLLESCRAPSAFSTMAWLDSWWTHYRGSAALRVLLVRRDGVLVAAAPLCLLRKSGVAVLSPLGTGLSDYCDLLVDERHRDEAVDRLTRALLDVPGWTVLDLTEAPPDAAVHAVAMRWPGRCWTVPASTCLYLPDRDLAALLARVPRRTRGHIRHKLRKVDALGIVEREVPADGVPGAIDELLRLHERQWAGRGGNPEHTSARFRGFLREAVGSLAAEGRASVQQYLLDGRVVAADIVMTDPARTATYVCGIDPGLRAHIDTAALLLRRNLALAHQSGTHVDMLRGTEDYKLHWRPGAIVNRRVILARPGSGPVRHTSALGYMAAVRARRHAIILISSYAPGLKSRIRRAQITLRHLTQR